MSVALKFLISFLVFFFMAWVVFTFSGNEVNQDFALIVGRFCGVGAIISFMYWLWSY